ncbi:hypothetical protein KNP414_06969 [Paenibacillus mucilaginosus KNP414]|uniref:Uncharacterized protein n=1 Tax=Paenibacillus mucilaginosus (strain KNP414) TaxID=1036673 RepID=F8FIM7_PAEMK|nr:hypothetical protein KNP414_06969 [Paenibacillus mucilaginosus KNP414]
MYPRKRLFSKSQKGKIVQLVSVTPISYKHALSLKDGGAA